MSILSGFFKTKKYRKTDTGYKLQSEWTSASTVEMADGNTAETNLGAIKGITSSLATENDNYALSASAGKNLQDQVTTLNTDLMWKVKTITNLFSVNNNSSVLAIKNAYEKRISAFLNTKAMTNGVTNNICSLPSDYYPNNDNSFVCASRNGIICVITIGSTGLVTVTPTTGNIADGDVIEFKNQTYAISV